MIMRRTGSFDRYANEFAPVLNGSAAMLAIKCVVEDVAETDAIVLIRGERGVGKDLVARAIHEASGRHNGTFVKVNCAAPLDLLESRLFGHEKGAFPGAHRRKLGQFEYANNGTIYLDEIGEVPLALQAKLLHVLQDFRFIRIGGQEPIRVDARVVAATSRNLEGALARGDFRKDLFHRLSAVELRIPPLRERREEIPVLAARFRATLNKQYGRDTELSRELLAELMEHPWPGNVRELENVVFRLVVLADSEPLRRGLSPREPYRVGTVEFRRWPTP